MPEIDARYPLWQQPDTTFSDMRAQLSCQDERGRLWRCGAAKFFMDGVVETGTVHQRLLEPDRAVLGMRVNLGRNERH